MERTLPNSDPNVEPGSKKAVIHLRLVCIIAVVLLAGCEREEFATSSGLDHYVIVFARNDTPLNDPAGTKRSLYFMQGDGPSVTDLSRHPPGGYGFSVPGYDWHPAFSPNGAYIAFQSKRDRNYEIYRMNADGSNVMNLTNWHDYDEDFRWSPDGSRIAFSRLDSGVYRIFVMNSDGSQQMGLTSPTSFSRYPDWSPDGSKIVFSRLNVGVTGTFFQVMTMNSDGSSQQPLTDSTESAKFPRWSKNGGRIFYFVSSFGMAYHDVIGTGHASLAQGFFPGDNISFSPDGSRFVTWGLKLVDQNLQISSSFNVVGDMPSWSSDGNWIVFIRTVASGSSCLFIVRPDGSDERQVTTSQYGDIYPVWKP
jgi:Tol biopolymer transport system component